MKVRLTGSSWGPPMQGTEVEIQLIQFHIVETGLNYFSEPGFEFEEIEKKSAGVPAGGLPGLLGQRVRSIEFMTKRDEE